MSFLKYTKVDGNTHKIDKLLTKQNVYISVTELIIIKLENCKSYLNNFNIKDHTNKKKLLVIITIFGLFCIYLRYVRLNSIEKIPVVHNSHVHGMKEYLVWTDHCKIPNINPYDPEAIKYFERQPYEPCSTQKPWTTVQFNSTSKEYTLYIDEKFTIDYGPNLDCCYRSILRNNSNYKYADNIIKFTKCFRFNKSVQISNTTDNILVTCKSNQKRVYINGHPMIPERADIRDRLKVWNNNDTKKPPSILMIGIDSISRINLLRAMPKTAQKLYNNEWFEMSGYNKIDDNTFPNLMAILTGFNLTTAENICDRLQTNKLNSCPMIWKLFHEYGYVTAYAEDEIELNTFTFNRNGFFKSPADYYLRPFLIAAEAKLPISLKSGLIFCLGYQHSADYVFDYALELSTRYKNKSYFGFFWTNSFSHDDLSDCSSMDLKVAEYLEKLSTNGILHDTVVIFFSDHGIRFGPIRETRSGHYEERLPFMFIWLPQWLKTKHPEFVNGLIANKNRLTNPYDIHMTLKHLLELSGRVPKTLPKAVDCPNCQSLLKTVPYNRTCGDIKIPDHMCTCIPYERNEINSDRSYKLAHFVVNYINDYLRNSKNYNVSTFCEKLKLHKIVGVFRANLNLISNRYPKNIKLYRLMLRTSPGNGLFEATIRRKIDTGELELTGRISRLNTYSFDSRCVHDVIAKLYCYCSKPSTLSRLISYFYNSL